MYIFAVREYTENTHLRQGRVRFYYYCVCVFFFFSFSFFQPMVSFSFILLASTRLKPEHGASRLGRVSQSENISDLDQYGERRWVTHFRTLYYIQLTSSRYAPRR